MDSGHTLKALDSLGNSETPVVEWVNGQIEMSYISRIHDSRISLSDVFMLSRHKNSLCTPPCSDTRFVDMIHSVLNYGMTMELKYGIGFLQARNKDMLRDSAVGNFHLRGNFHYLPPQHPYGKALVGKC